MQVYFLGEWEIVKESANSKKDFIFGVKKDDITKLFSVESKDWYPISNL